MKLKVGSLFSGIGGIELGLERTGGFETIWFCENEPYCRAVLNKNFPNIPVLGDIMKVVWDEVEKPDVIAGGFPCQDISVAGKGAGIKEGTRSGLWKEYARAIRALRPRYALVENVPMLAARGLDIVLADLAEMGYDAEWGIISAAEVGAPHRRERLFVIAHRAGERCKRGGDNREGNGIPPLEIRPTSQVASVGSRWERGAREILPPNAADSFKNGIPRPIKAGSAGQIGQRWKGGSENCAPEFRIFEGLKRIEDLRQRTNIPEPLVRRGAHGPASRLDSFARRKRIEALGNAVVPAVAQVAGEMILEKERGLDG